MLSIPYLYLTRSLPLILLSLWPIGEQNLAKQYEMNAAKKEKQQAASRKEMMNSFRRKMKRKDLARAADKARKESIDAKAAHQV